MNVRRPISERWLDPLLWVELFVLSNIGFLAGDIYLAHATNRFEHWAEWVPFGYSLVAPFLLLAAMVLAGPTPALLGHDGEPGDQRKRQVGRWIGLFVGWVGVVVGVAGFVLHLQSQFFSEQTLKNLVYTAPFVAPLSYAGLGLLLIMNRMVDSRSVAWARWVVLLALGGVIGNFVLSVADHAQNGFFRSAEWIPVVASALGVGSLVAVLIVYDNPPLLRMAAGVMALQAGVGVLGFVLHTWGDLTQPEGTVWEKILYGSPIFAPLLFADLAVLAVIGLWAMGKSASAPLTISSASASL
jgi:hypothetical protein